jgi:uncharacterized protein YbjT (DUF2867 family)
MQRYPDFLPLSMHPRTAHIAAMTTNQDTTLILGATGKTGRRVARRLLARGIPVRSGSRTGTPPFEWNDPHTWSAALLRDVGAVYIAYYPDLAVPAAAEQLRGFTEVAVRHGVRRIVLLSGRGEDGALPSEAAVRASGAALTILRAAFLCQNFSEGFLLDDVLRGEVAFPAGQVREPFVDADDLADMAVAALTGNDHAGATYDATGPRLLTFAEATAEIAAAAGRPVAFRSVSSEDYARALAAHLPGEDVAFFVELFRHVLDGHNSHLGDGVARVLGRPARDFRDYAREAATAGLWNR